MIIAIYVLAVLLFALAFTLTHLPQSFGQVMATIRQALMVIADNQIDDSAKERAAQQAALKLLKQSTLIVSKGAITVASALLPFWMANALSLKPWEETIEFALRWDVLGITTFVMLVAWLIWRRWLAWRN